MSVFSNLSNLLRTFGTLRTSRFAGDDPALFLFDGGTDSAYENYALLVPDELASRSESSLELAGVLDGGFRFFAKAERPHIWPLFPGLPDEVGDLLAARGARLDEVFHGMTLDLDAWKPLSAERDLGEAPTVVVVRPEEAEAWADATWFGFDSDEAPPDTFVRFAAGLSACEGVFLAASEASAEPGDEPRFSATGMMFLSEGSAGLYYIATRPAFRRRGLGARVVEHLLRIAQAAGCGEACLLATPNGRPLYERLGFEVVSRVPIHVFGEFYTDA